MSSKDKSVQKHARAEQEKLLKSLCEIKKRLVDTDCSPLHKESEELYLKIWEIIGEYYGWNKEDTQGQGQDKSTN